MDAPILLMSHLLKPVHQVLICEVQPARVSIHILPPKPFGQVARSTDFREKGTYGDVPLTTTREYGKLNPAGTFVAPDTAYRSPLSSVAAAMMTRLPTQL